MDVPQKSVNSILGGGGGGGAGEDLDRLLVLNKGSNRRCPVGTTRSVLESRGQWRETSFKEKAAIGCIPQNTIRKWR
jgi:hypothetical protein